MKKLAREPLLHFLVIAGLLYVYVAADTRANPYTITVDSAGLASYMSARAPAMSTSDMRSRLDSLSVNQRRALVDQYIEEEILIREARAMGLDRTDPAIRQQLLQRVHYIAEASLDSESPITDQELRAWYVAHAIDYQLPARVTFSHVFLTGENHSGEDIETRMRDIVTEINESKMPIHEAPALGDRFYWHRNYVDTEYNEVSSHFGSSFVDALFSLQPEARHWHGPIESDHGWHAVFVKELEPPRTPPLDELRARLRRDILAERRESRKQQFYATARERYEILVSLPDGSSADE